jgi:polyribonucleotide 5'-hydroxyl-kinase
VFTWEGAKLRLEGSPEVLYESEDTLMPLFANVHHLLEQRRAAARDAGVQGPRVLLVGPTDAGKSTAARVLANYAVRGGWQPALVDLDVGQGAVTVPGCVAAVALEQPIDVEEGAPLESPIVFYFGHLSPGDYLEHYRAVVERLA